MIAVGGDFVVEARDVFSARVEGIEQRFAREFLWVEKSGLLMNFLRNNLPASLPSLRASRIRRATADQTAGSSRNIKSKDSEL